MYNQLLQPQKGILKSIRLTNFHKPQLQSVSVLFQVCPSFPSFVFAVLFRPSFYIFSCYFYFVLSLGAVPTV